MRRWYVAQTQAHSEERARMNLERQGFETYLPRYLRERRHARRREIVTAPLFPGYVFIQFDLEGEPWRSINGTFGIAHLVCHGARPTPVPEGVGEAIAERATADGLIELQPPALRRGDALRIVSGALAECCGFFERMADRDRVVMLLDLLGRQVRVQAPLAAVTGA